ncbi:MULTISPECIES: ACP S-malonyltransferase [unclassified Providencia]|uniref:ACP S-malonyltransferase n=1 Tax=unclassified Providencia TaxID=2633465 RepID=UPI00234A4009|nr:MULTISPECIES: ACP S-malonyltransferase [unclassified Providencia]
MLNLKENIFLNIKDEWVFLFSGQGSPSLGMGANVRDISINTSRVWDCASDISGIDIRKLCIKGPMSKLIQTRYQQLAVTTINIATLTLLREKFSINEQGYSGHSAGEYSALYAAGVMDMETLFKAIDKRSIIMQSLAREKKGAMYVVKKYSYNKLWELIEYLGLTPFVNICCDNSNNQQVIGGRLEEVKVLVNYLLLNHIEVIKLSVNGAWHSELMRDGKRPLREYLEKLDFAKPKKTIIMNVSALNISNKIDIKNQLINQLTDTVKWQDTIKEWVKIGHGNFLEVGSKKTLLPLIDEIFPNNNFNKRYTSEFI